MDIILSLVLGAIAGILAVLIVYRSIPKSPSGWIGAILVGLIGGWVGSWLADLLGLETVNWIGSLVVAFAGALAILLLIRRVAPEK